MRRLVNRWRCPAPSVDKPSPHLTSCRITWPDMRLRPCVCVQTAGQFSATALNSSRTVGLCTITWHSVNTVRKVLNPIKDTNSIWKCTRQMNRCLDASCAWSVFSRMHTWDVTCVVTRLWSPVSALTAVDVTNTSLTLPDTCVCVNTINPMVTQRHSSRLLAQLIHWIYCT